MLRVASTDAVVGRSGDPMTPWFHVQHAALMPATCCCVCIWFLRIHILESTQRGGCSPSHWTLETMAPWARSLRTWTALTLKSIPMVVVCGLGAESQHRRIAKLDFGTTESPTGTILNRKSYSGPSLPTSVCALDQTLQMSPRVGGSRGALEVGDIRIVDVDGLRHMRDGGEYSIGD